MAIEAPYGAEPVAAMHNLDPQQMASPYSTLWWSASAVTDVPEDALGWLLAQGWRIASISYDETTTPPTPYYTLGRQEMNNWVILQGLIQQYTSSYNEARQKNALRYDDAINIWNGTLQRALAEHTRMVANSNAHVVLYVTTLSGLMDEVDTEAEAMRSDVLTGTAAVSTQLTAYLAKLGDFETNYAAHLATITTQLGVQTTALTNFLSGYDEKLGELEAEFATHLDDIETLLATEAAQVGAHVASFNTLLDGLTTAYDTHASALDAILTAADASQTTYEGAMTSLLASLLSDQTSLSDEIDALLTSADSLLTTHGTTISGLLGYLLSDYTTHETLTRGYLTGLGTTELARINERYDNLLAARLQELTDRGFYSSDQSDQVTVLVERERTQEIAALNDRLAREKVENEWRLQQAKAQVRMATLAGQERLHGVRQEILRYKADAVRRTYGELKEVRVRTIAVQAATQGLQQDLQKFHAQIKDAMFSAGNATRQRILDGQDRVQALKTALSRLQLDSESNLAGELRAIREQAIQAEVQQHAARQGVSQAAVATRDRLLAAIQAAVGAAQAGRERFGQLTLQNTEALSQARGRLCALKMETAANRLAGLRTTYQGEVELLKYQLAEQNNLLVGILGFMERREDTGPALGEIGALAASLGDAGSTTWLSP